ncbi:hypothetical protein Y032_0017g3382 [Ancylostoma ceylanicum]|uniref:Reverse transcriptase domain-containing protein n=1 Tax=Ancylostoma ceylanicum TaxID=53326 RepID=A0A016V4X6_9BILA|nr:hypothetical protein Y032_0017g3382 [Ancylostoma ceylanicum]
MDTISSDLQSTTPWTLLYEDDVMIATSTREELQQKVQAWKDRLEQYGMRLNIKKTDTLDPVSQLTVALQSKLSIEQTLHGVSGGSGGR